jgi:hypothetical protein
MRLDFIIPASPNDAFFSQIALYRLALDSLGGIYRDARLVAVFGDTQIVPLPKKWAPYFARIDIEWPDCAAFREISYHAQGARRFEVYRPDADLVVLCDADTLLLRPFPELVEGLTREPALAGVIANEHVPWQGSSGDPAADWQTISQAILGRRIDLDFHYLLDAAKPCPFYVNAGFTIAPPHIFTKFYARFQQLKPQVHDYIGSYFSSQIAYALAVADLQLPVLALPRRYNFANYPDADDRYPEELENIIVFHYFSVEFFNRHRIFTTAARFNKFLSLELTGCNKIFQDHVRRLTGEEYPFPGAEAPDNRLEDMYDDLRVDLGRLARYARSLEKALHESQAYSRQLEAENTALRPSP